MKYLSEEDVERIRIKHELTKTLKKERIRAPRAPCNRYPVAAEYRCWQSIKRRCSDPEFKYYCGRGITVCNRWINSYENFLKDMGPKPSPEHSIDRIDPNGDYAPENCRWATPEQQANNRRNNRKFTASFSIAEWAKMSGLPEQLIRNRIWSGWPVEKAVTLKEGPKGGWQTTRATFRGQTHSIATWAKILGFDRTTLYRRLEKGWTVDQTLRTPNRQQRKPLKTA